MSDLIDNWLTNHLDKVLLDTQDTLGNTPLHIACLHREGALISLLLRSGANNGLK